MAERIVAPAWVQALRAVDETLDGVARPGEVLGWALQERERAVLSYDAIL